MNRRAGFKIFTKTFLFYTTLQLTRQFPLFRLLPLGKLVSKQIYTFGTHDLKTNSLDGEAYEIFLQDFHSTHPASNSHFHFKTAAKLLNLLTPSNASSQISNHDANKGERKRR